VRRRAGAVRSGRDRRGGGSGRQFRAPWRAAGGGRAHKPALALAPHIRHRAGVPGRDGRADRSGPTSPAQRLARPPAVQGALRERRERHLAFSKQPSYLKRQKEQQRLARANEKREARRARKHAKGSQAEQQEALDMTPDAPEGGSAGAGDDAGEQGPAE